MQSKMSDPTFTFLNNDRICQLIYSAKKCIVYAAPSMSKLVAAAFWGPAVFNNDVPKKVVVDANAEAFRNGFGEIEGLKDCVAAGIEVHNAPGLRIGVLVVDERAWVFAPTPEIIFDQPGPDTLNSVEVSKDFAEQVLVAVAPAFSMQEGAIDSPILAESSEPEIGHTLLTEEHVQALKTDLELAPPQKFDLARQVNVYKSYYQFVEIELSNCNIGAFTIPISPRLLSIVEDDAVRSRLSAKYKLVEPDSKIKQDLTGLRDAVKDLRAEFTIMINERLGRVIPTGKKNEFLGKVQRIKDWIKKLTGEIEGELTQEIAENCQKLAKVLVPIVQENEPRYLANRLLGDFTNEPKIIGIIVNELMPSEGAIKRLIAGMALEVDFKDITYEMLNDEDFVDRIKELNPGIEHVFEEGPALKAKRQSEK